MFVNVCRTYKDDGPPLFRFASMPKPTTKYVCPPRLPKEKKSNLKYYNIMSDPRVRRGSYAFDIGPKIPEMPYYPCFDMVQKDPVCRLYIRTLMKCPSNVEKTKDEVKITPSKFHKSFSRKSNRGNKSKPNLDDLSLVGTSATESQTDIHYEILSEETPPVPNCTQTDVVSDLSYSLLGYSTVKNTKTGDDVETQIIPGELFYFDQEIANVVTNCVSAVVEQSLLELMMESELDALMAQQRAYEAKKNLELSRLQRLRKRQQDLVDENERLLQREREAMEEARQAGEPVPPGMLAKHYLNDVLGSAVDGAGVLEHEEVGNDADPIMEWVEKQAQKSHKITLVSREILDDILRNTAATIEASYYHPLVEDPEEEEYQEEVVGEGIEENANILDQYEYDGEESNEYPDFIPFWTGNEEDDVNLVNDIYY